MVFSLVSFRVYLLFEQLHLLVRLALFSGLADRVGAGRGEARRI